MRMRNRWFRVIAAAVVFGIPSMAAAQLPSSFTTPGKAAKANEAQVCSADFAATAKPPAKWQREEALSRYGRRPEDFTGELDYLIPLSLGGTADPDNLWPQPAQGEFNIDAKNKLEDKLHQLVCTDKTLTLKQAQDLIKKDWVKAYNQYVQGAAAAK